MAIYSPVPKEVDGDEEVESDHEGLLLREKYDSRLQKWRRFTWVAIGTEFALILILVLEVFLLNHQYSSCVRAPKPPFCKPHPSTKPQNLTVLCGAPLYDDGAVRYVNKEIRYDPLFHHEESPDYEEAWEKPLRGECSTLQERPF